MPRESAWPLYEGIGLQPLAFAGFSWCFLRFMSEFCWDNSDMTRFYPYIQPYVVGVYFERNADLRCQRAYLPALRGRGLLGRWLVARGLWAGAPFGVGGAFPCLPYSDTGGEIGEGLALYLYPIAVPLGGRNAECRFTPSYATSHFFFNFALHTSIGMRRVLWGCPFGVYSSFVIGVSVSPKREV